MFRKNMQPVRCSFHKKLPNLMPQYFPPFIGSWFVSGRIRLPIIHSIQAIEIATQRLIEFSIFYVKRIDKFTSILACESHVRRPLFDASFPPTSSCKTFP